MQFLPNRNVFLRWGSTAFVLESKADGTPVFSAYFATTGALHCRAYKFNFTSNPSGAPALYTYADNNSAPTTIYASWNGATEVASWNHYGGSSAKSMKKLGNTQTEGFETVATQPDHYAFTMTEAVAGNVTALRKPSVIRTFVPGPAFASVCTGVQCPLIGEFSHQEELFNVNDRPTGTSSGPTRPQVVAEISATPTSSSLAMARSWSLDGLAALTFARFV